MPKKILIADDDRQMLQLLSMAVTKAGFDIVNALDGYLGIPATA